jgi:thiol-disulfide isomerase/thioredoxin
VEVIKRILYKSFFLYLLFLSVLVYGQKGVEIGSKAPKINITHWFKNVPKSKILSDKFVVLDFWESTCEPCMKNFKFIDSLININKNDNVVFLSMTNENPNKIKKILNKISSNSTIVCDTTSITQKNFGNGKWLDYLPFLVLIDNDKVIWKGSPSDLKINTFINFLNKELNIELDADKSNIFKSSDLDFYNAIGNDDVTDYFVIEKSNFNFSFKRKNKRNQNTKKAFIIYDANLEEVLTSFLGYHPKFVDVSELIKNRIDIRYINKNDNFDSESLELKILELFEARKIDISKNIIAKKILLVRNDLLEISEEKKFSKSIFSDSENYFGITIDDLVKIINENQDEFFFIESGLKDVKLYDFSLNYTDFFSLNKSLEKYGFQVFEELIKIDCFNFIIK